MNRVARAGAGVAFILFVLSASGCGGPATARLSGEVRFQGKPIALGQVTFVGRDGRVGVAAVNDGAYTAPQVPVGPVKIAVTSFPPGPKFIKPGDPTPPPEPAVPPAAYVPIPERYADPDKSGLTYTVTNGPQQHDIDLTP